MATRNNAITAVRRMVNPPEGLHLKPSSRGATDSIVPAVEIHVVGTVGLLLARQAQGFTQGVGLHVSGVERRTAHTGDDGHDLDGITKAGVLTSAPDDVGVFADLFGEQVNHLDWPLRASCRARPDVNEHAGRTGDVHVEQRVIERFVNHFFGPRSDSP